MRPYVVARRTATGTVRPRRSVAVLIAVRALVVAAITMVRLFRARSMTVTAMVFRGTVVASMSLLGSTSFSFSRTFASMDEARRTDTVIAVAAVAPSLFPVVPFRAARELGHRQEGLVSMATPSGRDLKS